MAKRDNTGPYARKRADVLLVKRGLFENELRRQPYNWELDQETAREVDRLFAILQNVLSPES